MQIFITITCQNNFCSLLAVPLNFLLKAVYNQTNFQQVKTENFKNAINNEFSRIWEMFIFELTQKIQ